MKKEFITKDSWNRESFSTGSLRDTQEWKPRYDLISIHLIENTILNKNYWKRLWKVIRNDREVDYKLFAFNFDWSLAEAIIVAIEQQKINYQLDKKTLRAYDKMYACAKDYIDYDVEVYPEQPNAKNITKYYEKQHKRQEKSWNTMLDLLKEYGRKMRL